MESLISMLASAVSGGGLSLLVYWLMFRQKMKTEAEIKVSELAKNLAEDLRKMLNEQMERSDELQKQVDELKKENLEWKSRLQRKEIENEVHIDHLKQKLEKATHVEPKK